MSNISTQGETRRVLKQKLHPYPTVKFAKLALVILGCILASACGTLCRRVVYDPMPAVIRLRNGGQIQAEADALAMPLVAKGENVGIVVGVVTPDGMTQVFGYGRRSMDEDGPPTGDTEFAVGSLTKVFVASTLATMVAEGSARYTETVRSILPSSVPLSRSVGEITLHELVTHTSGLKREPFTGLAGAYLVRYFFTGRNVYGYLDKKYLYRYLSKCQLPPAGQRPYDYSNIGAGLLGHLLEVKTGRTLSSLVAERITSPLGMHNTVFTLSEEQHRGRAQGYSGDQPLFMRRNVPQPIWDMGEIMHGAGGMWSTADDLLIFAKAQLGMIDHPLTSILASTRRAQVKLRNEQGALGWSIDHIGTEALCYMYGVSNGHTSYFGLDENARVAVVVLCNNFNWDDKVGHNLLLRLSRGLK